MRSVFTGGSQECFQKGRIEWIWLTLYVDPGDPDSVIQKTPQAYFDVVDAAKVVKDFIPAVTIYFFAYRFR